MPTQPDLQQAIKNHTRKQDQKKQDPIGTIAPVSQVPAAPPSTDPVQSRTAKDELSPIGKQIDHHLSIYRASLLQNQGRVPANVVNKAAQRLSQATALLVANPTDEALNLFWNFHVDNAKTVCREHIALQGDHSLEAKPKDVTRKIYTVFRYYVTKEGNPPADNKILSVIPSQRILQFLKARSRAVRPVEL